MKTCDNSHIYQRSVGSVVYPNQIQAISVTSQTHHGYDDINSCNRCRQKRFEEANAYNDNPFKKRITHVTRVSVKVKLDEK